MTIYRVYYTREVPGSAVVHGCVDMTQEHVENTHKGSVMSALLDSNTDLTFKRVTRWESLEV